MQLAKLRWLIAERNQPEEELGYFAPPLDASFEGSNLAAEVRVECEGYEGCCSCR